MRKMLLTPLIVCIVALLSLLSMPVHATKPIQASGKWSYTFPSSFIEIRDVDSNRFMHADEDGRWYDGPFKGISYDVFTVVMHKTKFDEEGNLVSSSFWNVEGLIYFDGTVDGKEGSLVISFIGKKPWGEDWYGQWVIISGTEGLANLRGQGTWEGAGAPAPFVEGDLEYSGKIHFD